MRPSLRIIARCWRWHWPLLGQAGGASCSWYSFSHIDVAVSSARDLSLLMLEIRTGCPTTGALNVLWARRASLSSVLLGSPYSSKIFAGSANALGRRAAAVVGVRLESDLVSKSAAKKSIASEVASGAASSSGKPYVFRSSVYF